jgi:hypothetical protein
MAAGGWDFARSALPVATLALGYFADVGKAAVSDRYSSRRAQRDADAAALMTLQDSLCEMFTVAQDAAEECRADEDGTMTFETGLRLYQAHMRVESQRVRIDDEDARTSLSQWNEDVYAYGVQSEPARDIELLNERFNAINERLGVLYRALRP